MIPINAESRLCNLSCSGFPRNNGRSKDNSRRGRRKTICRNYAKYSIANTADNVSNIAQKRENVITLIKFTVKFLMKACSKCKTWWTFYIVKYITQFCGFHLPPWNLPNRVLALFDLRRVYHQHQLTWGQITPIKKNLLRLYVNIYLGRTNCKPVQIIAAVLQR